MIFTLILTISSVFVAESWDYPYNESEWGRVSATCTEGTMQSPVDIAPHSDIAQTELNITYDMPTDLVESSEYDLTWTVESDTPPTLLYENMVYALSKVECHFGSEHTVDGFRYPGSCHFVHHAGNKYTIIAIFLNDNAVTMNAAFIAALRDPDQLWGTMISGLDLHYYWEYTGSFTRPNCTENVKWIILRDVVEVTPAVIVMIKSQRNVENTYRDTMPLNGRAVRDGSEIGNITVLWSVITGDVSVEQARTVLTNSVSEVIDLPVESVLIHTIKVHGTSESEPTPLDVFDIEWKLSVLDNTRSFVDRLLVFLNETGHRTNFTSAIIEDFEAETGDTLKYFYSVRAQVIDTTFWDLGVDRDGDQDNTVIIIVAVVGALLLFVILILAFYVRKRKLEKQVAVEITLDGQANETAGNETTAMSEV